MESSSSRTAPRSHGRRRAAVLRLGHVRAARRLRPAHRPVRHLRLGHHPRLAREQAADLDEAVRDEAARR